MHEPYRRLIEIKQLIAYRYKGFWAAMDTFKDREWLNSLHEADEAPWQVWRDPGRLQKGVGGEVMRWRA